MTAGTSQNNDVFENTELMKSFLLLVFDGIFYMMHNVFAFTVTAMVAPFSYSVANAMKRVVIIGASLFLLRNPVTTINVAGMLIACFGVLCYNKIMYRFYMIQKSEQGFSCCAKYDQNKARRRAETMPYVHIETNLQAHLNPKGLPHSKTEVNLLNRNGMIHPEDHILLQNNPMN